MRRSVALMEQPVLAGEDEGSRVEALHVALELVPPMPTPARLIAPGGTQLEIPPSVHQVLTRVVHELAQGNAVAVMPVHAQLTTQQAADLLGVSRPYLVDLLEHGAIPFARPGKHRRLMLADLIEYKRQHELVRREALDEANAEAERLGLEY